MGGSAWGFIAGERGGWARGQGISAWFNAWFYVGVEEYELRTTSDLEESLKSDPDPAENESKDLRNQSAGGGGSQPTSTTGMCTAFTHPLGIHTRER